MLFLAITSAYSSAGIDPTHTIKGIYSPWSSKSRFDKKIYIVRYGNKMSSKEEDSELFFRWLK
ncbi:hypothetical protein T08_1233 [Trichinella sp. T8]|nr:hypothetical protein T08_1233 [Trichinella sp. T8]